MAIKYQPDVGTILLCDFSGSLPPEMCKKRPVIVLASVSPRLCIVVPCSTSDPETQETWHCLVNTPNPLPPPYDHKVHWAKGDMICTVSFDRLFMPQKGKDKYGNRLYVKIKLPYEEMENVRRCVLAAIAPKALDSG